MLSIGSCRDGYIVGIQPVVHLQTGRQAPGCQPTRIIPVNGENVRDAQESLSHHHRRRRCSSLQKCVHGLSLGGVMRHLLLCSVPRESVNRRGGDDRKGSGRRRKWRGMRRTNGNRDGESQATDVPETNVGGSSVDLLSSDFHSIPICRFVSHLSE